MTPKYSAEWWEKVAARTLETVFQQQRPTGPESADTRDGRDRETARTEPEMAISFTNTR
jgi:hypothetical protein